MSDLSDLTHETSNSLREEIFENQRKSMARREAIRLLEPVLRRAQQRAIEEARRPIKLYYIEGLQDFDPSLRLWPL